MSARPKSLIALDFDGVLCDSADETATTGWCAAATIWPRHIIGSPSPAYIQAFSQVRPALETGFESILIARLLHDGMSPAELKAHYATTIARVASDHGLTRQQLIQAFGACRDEQIARDSAAWLALHRFYPGSIEAANAWLDAGHRVAIVTTKETRFACDLAEAAGLRIPKADIYGLESGTKGPLLVNLLKDLPPDARALFVEDRLPTLKKIIARPDLGQLELFLADWGYLRDGDRESAAATTAIRIISLSEFQSIAPVS